MSIINETFSTKVLPELLPNLTKLGVGRVKETSAETLAAIRGLTVTTLTARAAPQPLIEMQDHQVRSHEGHDILVRTYRPAGQNQRLSAVLNIHGGGMITGSVQGDQATCIRMALSCDALVASVEYRLAPEHPFPAGLNDCYDALLWLREHAAVLNVDRLRLAVAGNSAGAGLAASVALLSRDRNGPAICFQALASPMLDDRTKFQGNEEFSGIPGWSVEVNAFAWKCLLPNGGDDSTYAAPARADDLSGLPAAYISIGSLELFRDEALKYASRLAKAGVPVELHLYPGAYHGWERLNPAADLTKRSTRERDIALRGALYEAGT